MDGSEIKSETFRFPTLQEIAHEYLAAGIAVIPLALNGSKSPAIKSWREYQRELPTIDQVDQWWSRPQGMATITGVVSGGLEVLDFDHDAKTIFPQWHQLIEDIAVRLPIVETPSGGFHVYYRCQVVCGNTKIAMADKETLIETRGEGGYIVNPSSPAAVHSLNYPYVQVAGPILPEIPTITPSERLALWKAARTFDRAETFIEQLRAAQPRPQRPRPAGDKPWQRFDAQADWEGMLRSDGWQSRDGQRWTRPGKRSGTSATLRQASGGDWVLVVFSSNAGVQPRTYTASAYLAYSRYGGDFKRANQAILEVVR